MIYLCNYPYECTEQIASKLMTIVALKDVLYAFKNNKELPDIDNVNSTIRIGLIKIQQRQHSNGGFGYWDPINCKCDPFLTCHVFHLFARCVEKVSFFLLFFFLLLLLFKFIY